MVVPRSNGAVRGGVRGSRATVPRADSGVVTQVVKSELEEASSLAGGDDEEEMWATARTAPGPQSGNELLVVVHTCERLWQKMQAGDLHLQRGLERLYAKMEAGQKHMQLELQSTTTRLTSTETRATHTESRVTRTECRLDALELNKANTAQEIPGIFYPNIKIN